MRPSSHVQVPAVESASTQRALDALTDAVQTLQGKRERDHLTVDLVVGTNKVQHGLGRACIGYTVTPTYATIAFGHALDTTNPHPEREVWIVVLGSDQPAAVVEVF
jgi:hypothetical protein